MTDPINTHGRLVQFDTAKPAGGKVDRRSNALTSDTKPASAPDQMGGSAADRVDLSAFAKSLDAEPAFDRSKVDSIKRAIQEGQYAIDPRRIAESFVAIERMISK